MPKGQDHKAKVVLLGAGFAGLGAMNQLKKADIDLTVVDKNDYHAFQPLLYQVATAELGSQEVAFPVRDLLHDHNEWRFHQGAVTGIDLNEKQVAVEGMEPIPYDYLVVGLGAQVNFFGTRGTTEHAFPMYTLSDAMSLRSHVLTQFEAVDKNPPLVDEGALTFCIVGGGATGVETAGALAELISTELKEDYPNLPVEKAEVHLYELGSTLLKPFKPKLQKYAQKALEERDVQVHLGEGVVEVEPDLVHLKSGEKVKAKTLIWAAGLTAAPAGALLDVELVRGRVPVEPDLSLKGHPEVFVTGDMASFTDPETKRSLPQLGSVALQAGSHAGDNITRLLKGEETEPFKYHDKGTMATIGRGAAVVEFDSGRTMTGHAAWLAWLGVHLMLLSGGQEKSLTFLDWGWSLLRDKRGKRIEVE
jgi:NADH dehydrogenase